jgi:hypothetical protein
MLFRCLPTTPYQSLLIDMRIPDALIARARYLVTVFSHPYSGMYR